LGSAGSCFIVFTFPEGLSELKFELNLLHFGSHSLSKGFLTKGTPGEVIAISDFGERQGYPDLFHPMMV